MDSSVVKHLLSTMQGPGFDPQHHRKTTEKNMPGMVAQTCNLSTQETKAGVLSASLKFHVVKRKKKKKGKLVSCILAPSVCASLFTLGLWFIVKMNPHKHVLFPCFSSCCFECRLKNFNPISTYPSGFPVCFEHCWRELTQ